VTLLVLGAIGWAALVAPAPPFTPSPPGRSDYITFQSVVDQLRRGGAYYDVMGAELRSRGYPTGNVFNWRTPLHLEVVARMPGSAARMVLFALLLTLCAATIVVIVPRFRNAWVVSTGLQVGVAVIFAAPSLVLLGDTWAGVLIGLSVLLFIWGRIGAAVAAGVLALFMRELAAPFCVVCAALALAERRWRELRYWAIGAACYAAYYAYHASQVWAHQAAVAEGVRVSSWLKFGGLPFLLATIRWMGWMFVLPEPALAVALVAMAAGLAGRRAPPVVRVASAAYAAFFLVAGQPFNHYWGLVAAPLWALSCGYGFSTITQAAKVAIGPLWTRSHERGLGS
jgi:hypothetical protein